LIYIVGLTKEELGGSKYLELLGHDCNNIPKVDAKNAKVLMDKLSSCSEKGLIRSIHDCSEGGLAVSLAEMAFAGGLGAEVFLKEVPFTKKHEKRNDFILFSESNSRFLVEIEPENQKKFESMLKGSVFGHIGSVCSTKRLKIFGVNNGLVIDASLSSLKESWQKTLRW
jgi:phosphoribosylformylglycinamidine synthase